MHYYAIYGKTVAGFDSKPAGYPAARTSKPPGSLHCDFVEGAGGESLGQYGHSKDYRGHLKQVVLGIVLDDADRPIASFLMPGNTADVTLP